MPTTVPFEALVGQGVEKWNDLGIGLILGGFVMLWIVIQLYELAKHGAA